MERIKYSILFITLTCPSSSSSSYRRVSWLSGRALDSGEKGGGGSWKSTSALLCPLSLYSPKVLVIPRKRWLGLNMTEKLLTGMLNLNTNKQNHHHIHVRVM